MEKLLSAVRPQAAARAPANRGSGAPGPGRRQRNARGQGARLTDEIVSGALALIDRTGSDEAVTLRAAAREGGIAAPGLYAHFADRDAVGVAGVVACFGGVTARSARGGPVGR